MIPYNEDLLWVVIVGFIIAFVLAFGIGANDVANSFGTSVGSKVLSLKQACFIASIFEVAGAVLIGARVSDTVRKGIIDITSFNDTRPLAMVGSFSALGGTSIWLLIASFLRLPISGTHSVVGATIGYALVEHGLGGVHWKKFGLIAASWVVSPLMSGIVSSVLFVLIRTTILNKNDSFKAGLKFLPFIYAITVAINLFSIFYKGSHLLKFNEIPFYGVMILTFGGGILFGILVKIFVAPWLERKVQEECNESVEEMVKYSPNGESKVIDAGIETKNDGKFETVVNFNDSDGVIQLLPSSTPSENMSDKSIENGTLTWKEQIKEYISGPKKPENISKKDAMKIARELVADEPKSARIFSFLQILTASFGAFAHGGNDVSNAIGPLISIWVIYQTGEIVTRVETPIWILVYGGVGIVIGLWVWGRRVIQTLGEDLTPITPSSGFSIEIGSAVTVLLASNLGIPISTTHCKVGSVVMVGQVRSREVVDWKLFRSIIISWIVTIPVSGGLSAAMYAGLRKLF